MKIIEPTTLAKLTKEQFNEQTVTLTETIKGAGKAGVRTQTRRQAGKKGK